MMMQANMTMPVQAAQPQTQQASAQQTQQKPQNDAFLKAVQQAQAKSEQASAQTTTTKQPSQQDPTGQDMTHASEDVQALDRLDVVSGDLTESRGDGILSFLTMLFGPQVTTLAENGTINGEMDDQELLKKLAMNLNDPAAQFAALMMLAFLQANPDMTIDQISQSISPEMLANPDIPAATKISTAIMRMMQQDPSLQGSDILTQLLDLSKSGTLEVFPRAQLLFFKMEGEVIKNEIVPQQTPAQAKPEGDLEARFNFQSSVMQAQKLIKSQPENRPLRVLDIDKLQEQVDKGAYLQNTAVRPISTDAQQVKLPETPIEPREVMQQVTQGLQTNLADGKSEFVMKLRPEGLGELTVRLVEVAGKMTLSITASSVATQRLLNAEMSNLQAAMRPLNVQVEPMQTVQQNDRAMQGDFLFEQFEQQTFQGGQQGGQSRYGHAPEMLLAEDEEQTVPQPVAETPESMLNAYI